MNADLINQLITAAYASTVSPEKYDEIMDVFDDVIFDEAEFTNTPSEPTGNDKHILDPKLAMHFQRAHEIHEKLGRQKSAPNQAQYVVDHAPSPAIIFDATEQIFVMNGLAHQLGPPHLIGMSLSDYGLTPHCLDHIRRFIKKSSQDDNVETVLIEPNAFTDPAQNSCILLRKIDMPDHNAVDQYFLTSVNLGFDRSTTSLLQKTYSLTDAETDITFNLADGKKAQEIATIRNANISTIRTQIKSIKKKTKCRDIPAIVRLACGFSAGLYVSAQISDNTPSYLHTGSPYKKPAMITLRDGRKLSYLEQGDPNGTPILLVHNMLYGSELTDAAVQAAFRQNLRIISPSRPGYGSSDPIDKTYGNDLLNLVCGDLRELLDHLGISKTMIIGIAIGSVYALRFATLYPHRTSALFATGHAPIWRSEWMAELPKRQRLIARITQYAPKLLPLVTRAGVALIDQGRGGQFIDALHRDIPVDMTALKRNGVYDHICRGLEETVAQGADAFCRDCAFPLSDYCQEARELKTPFHFIHGGGDMVVPLSRVENFVERVPNSTFEVVKNAGQFLIYTHWEIIFAAFKRTEKTFSKP